MPPTCSSTTQPISIALINVPAITADLMKRAFAKRIGYEIAGCAANMDDAIRLVTSHNPDVAIIHSSEKEGFFTAISLLEEFSRLGSAMRSIVISLHLTDNESAAYLGASARGVLSAGDANFEVLCECLTRICAGQRWANGEPLACSVQTPVQSRSLRVLNHPRVVNHRNEPILSEREDEVLQLLSTGMSNQELAKALSLSEHTIKNHVFHIFNKLGVSNRTEAVIYATNHREKSNQLRRLEASVESIPSSQRSAAGGQILNALSA